jgi:hypothetical protein
MTLLHNMSVPPRTAALLGGRPVASGVAVYSLPFALIWTQLVPGGPYGHKLGRLILHDPAELAVTITATFPTPADLFRRIGRPLRPALHHDFLLGWRPTPGHLTEHCPRPEPAPEGWTHPSLCCDPRRCAGVLARCYGTVLLARRAPDFSWARLLVSAVAFDEPLFPAA